MAYTNQRHTVKVDSEEISTIVTAETAIKLQYPEAKTVYEIQNWHEEAGGNCGGHFRRRQIHLKLKLPGTIEMCIWCDHTKPGYGVVGLQPTITTDVLKCIHDELMKRRNVAVNTLHQLELLGATRNANQSTN